MRLLQSDESRACAPSAAEVRGNVTAKSNWETDHKTIFSLLISFQANFLHPVGFSYTSVVTWANNFKLLPWGTIIINNKIIIIWKAYHSIFLWGLRHIFNFFRTSSYWYDLLLQDFLLNSSKPHSAALQVFTHLLCCFAPRLHSYLTGALKSWTCTFKTLGGNRWKTSGASIYPSIHSSMKIFSSNTRITRKSVCTYMYTHTHTQYQSNV